MKNVITLLIIALLAGIVFTSGAQQKTRKHDPQRRSKIDSTKTAFLTERLNLSKEQSEKFWPMYKEYNEKKRALRKELGALKAMDGNLTATDEQLKDELNKRIALKQKDVDLEKEYLEKFQKVITTRQVAELYHSEKLFYKQMIRNLRGDRPHQKRK